MIIDHTPIGFRATVVGAALLLTTAALAGCTTSPSYSSPEAIQRAYTEAGGACDDALDLPEAMLSEGAHGVTCGPPLALFIVFDDESAKDRYLARSGSADETGWITVGGERWIATGEDADALGALGGAEIAR